MVKRYSQSVHLSECDDGIYVLYSDYKKLENVLLFICSLIDKFIREQDEDDHK